MQVSAECSLHKGTLWDGEGRHLTRVYVQAAIVATMRRLDLCNLMARPCSKCVQTVLLDTYESLFVNGAASRMSAGMDSSYGR